MTQWLKVSTAFTFRLGPFVDDADGKTAETALTLAQADFRLSKAGGAFASKNETTSGAHDENGYYTCILNTTDTNTLGTLDVNVSESGALPVFRNFMVVPAQVWDSYFGADALQVHAVEISNALITAASIAADAITDAKVAADVTIASVTGAVGSVTGAVGSVTGAVGSVGAGGITAASFAADAITAAKIAADVTTELQAGLATSANQTTIIGYLDTEVAAILAAVDTEVAAIKAKTDLIPGTLYGKTFAEFISLMGAALLGKASGMATTTATFRQVDDSGNAIVATVDADGNRTAVTLTP